MQYFYLFIVVGILSLVGVLGCVAGDQPVKDSELKPIVVSIKSMRYEPKKLEIHVGDSVVWTNDSRTKHTATSDDDGKTFNTGEIEQGKSSKPIKFETEGEFN